MSLKSSPCVKIFLNCFGQILCVFPVWKTEGPNFQVFICCGNLWKDCTKHFFLGKLFPKLSVSGNLQYSRGFWGVFIPLQGAPPLRSNPLGMQDKILFHYRDVFMLHFFYKVRCLSTFWLSIHKGSFICTSHTYMTGRLVSGTASGFPSLPPGYLPRSFHTFKFLLLQNTEV